MPRKGRGGRREGTPGKAYQQRTDLNQNRQPIQAVPNQAYGVAGAQRSAQRTLPLPQMAPVIPLDQETDRPDEPLTAGIPMGEGPGPEALGFGEGFMPADEDEAELRAIYAAYPSEELRELIEDLE